MAWSTVELALSTVELAWSTVELAFSVFCMSLVCGKGAQGEAACGVKARKGKGSMAHLPVSTAVVKQADTPRGVLKYWILCGGLRTPPFFRNCFRGGFKMVFGCMDANPPLPHPPRLLLFVSSNEFCAKCCCMISSCFVHIITIY